MKYYMERNKILVDSCVWVAFFDINDRQHEKAVKVFQNLQKKEVKVVIHLLVLIETLSILKYKGIVKSNLKKIKEKMLNGRIFEFVGETKLDINEKFFEKLFDNNRMGLVDLILLDYCEKNEIDLMTLDKSMALEWKLRN